MISEQETFAEIVRRKVAAVDPDKIILFGSRARGHARPESEGRELYDRTAA
jgi:predicted nucleotidyltransferase